MAALIEMVRRFLARLRATPRYVVDAQRTIIGLRDEIQELRSLNQRVAELTDLVAEVLVPIADRDDARVKKLLDEYYRKSF